MPDVKRNSTKKLKVFPIRKRELKRWITLISGIILTLFSIGLLLYFSLIAWTAIENHGRAILIRYLPFILPLLLIVFPLGLILIIFTRLHWWDSISIDEAGLRIKNGFRRTDLSWSNIERFDTRVTNIQFAGNSVNTRIKIVLKLNNGRTIIIKNKYRWMSELIRQIRNKTLPILTEDAYEQLNNGQEIFFHKQLVGSVKGLSVNGQIIDWSGFEKPVIKNGILSLRDKDGEENLIKTSINQIKNLDLLLSLIANPPRISHNGSTQ